MAGKEQDKERHGQIVQGHDAPEPVFHEAEKIFLPPDFSCMFRADQVMTKPEITKKIYQRPSSRSGTRPGDRLWENPASRILLWCGKQLR